MNKAQTENIELIVGLLREKLLKHQKGIELLSTQELLKVYEVFRQEQPIAETFFRVHVNQLDFLDSYQIDSDTCRTIETFLYDFLRHIKVELSQISGTNKDADKLP
jgi:hypothetical protein